MKITIQDRTTTITIENADSNSSKTRRLLDYLLGQESRTNTTRARAVIAPVGNLPVNSTDFNEWLNSRSPLETLRALDNELFAEGNGTMMGASTAHMFVKKYPTVAAGLGVDRLADLFVWMSDQGYYAHAPAKRSVLTYYNLATRLCAGRTN